MILPETKNYKLENKKGFVALMSAIIISVILLLLVTNLSLTGFYSRLNILDSELKDRSSALAEACADMAILKLVNDINYVLVAMDHNISVKTEYCDIYSLTSTSSNITIITKANYNNIYFTTLKIIVDSTNNMSVISWEEI